MTGTIIVTGSGRGIGAATALLAGQKGYAVCVNYANRSERAEQVVAEIRNRGGKAIAVQADVSDEEAVLWLLSEQASYCTGSVLTVSGGR